MTKTTQLNKFKQAAKAVECNIDEKEFDAVLGEIAVSRHQEGSEDQEKTPHREDESKGD